MMVFHYLGKISYAKVGRLVHGAGCGTLEPVYQLHYRGFSRAVLPDKTYLVTFADVEVQIVQKGETSICYCKPINGYHQAVS